MKSVKLDWKSSYKNINDKKLIKKIKNILKEIYLSSTCTGQLQSSCEF